MEKLDRSAQNALAAGLLDRNGWLRRDPEKITEILEARQCRILPVWRGMNLFTIEEVTPIYLSHGEMSVVPEIYLGTRDGIHYFAAPLHPSIEDAKETFSHLGKWKDLRKYLPLLDNFTGEVLAAAKAYGYYRDTHRYCGRCGKVNEVKECGHMLACSDPECSAVNFPRTDPAVIVLVTDGDRCLMGRQPSWPAGRYSALAGFVEPGESLENAVRREVAEETGVVVNEVVYRSSQPWPFPSSLMVGFRAVAGSTEISLNDQELEDARWFTREELRQLAAGGAFGGPPFYSIAFKLMEEWFDQGNLGKLGELWKNW